MKESADGGMSEDALGATAGAKVEAGGGVLPAESTGLAPPGMNDVAGGGIHNYPIVEPAGSFPFRYGTSHVFAGLTSLMGKLEKNEFAVYPFDIHQSKYP